MRTPKKHRWICPTLRVLYFPIIDDPNSVEIATVISHVYDLTDGVGRTRKWVVKLDGKPDCVSCDALKPRAQRMGC